MISAYDLLLLFVVYSPLPVSPQHVSHNTSDVDNLSDFDPHSFPLNHGETLVVPHPHSGREPYVIQPSRSGLSGSAPALSSASADSDISTAWFPFCTREDFEQAELFLTNNCSDKFINRQLALSARAAPQSRITLRNAQEIHQLLQAGIDNDNLGRVTFTMFSLHL